MNHFAGGDAYLCGLVAFIVCQVALAFAKTARARRWLIIGGRLGFVWAAADPPPIPWILLAAFLALVVAWLVSQKRNRKAADSADAGTAPSEPRFRIGLAAIALMGIACEIPYLFYQAPDLPARTLCVVGDSVTAGLNDGEVTWPKQVSRRVSTSVVDASQPGATLKSAQKQVELLNQQGGDVLLLEIGGNDLLEGLPLAEFERDMDQLLEVCQQPGRSTVMFELPLPPLAMRYLAIQRRLAKQHRVTLIPRRRFLQVLTAPQSTVDGIHLSKSGQTRMADLVQKLLKFPEGGNGAYRHFEPVH